MASASPERIPDLPYEERKQKAVEVFCLQKERGEEYLRLAQEAGEQIQNVEPEDQEIFFGDFQSGPWYGMK